MEEKNNLSIPGAIIVVGILIAGAILLSNKSNTPAPANNNAQAQASSISIKPINTDDHILGNPNAPIVIVEYSDTECPYCKVFQNSMQTVVNTYGKDGQVAWVYRHFTVHSLSPNEADAIECANAQGGNAVFWNYIDNIFSTTTSTDSLNPAILPMIAGELGLNVTKFNACLAGSTYAGLIRQEGNDAVAAGAQGTPFSVMILKTSLTSDKENTINMYTANQNLAQNILISSDNKEITLNGAIPLANVKNIIDTILK